MLECVEATVELYGTSAGNGRCGCAVGLYAGIYGLIYNAAVYGHDSLLLSLP